MPEIVTYGRSELENVERAVESLRNYPVRCRK
jgi:hypothetical protein